MPPASTSNSFIPKHGKKRRVQSVASRQIYVFTLISYVAFFATLAIVAALFLYNRYADLQLERAVADLNREIAGFNNGDMIKVQSFDMRLKQAKNRLDNSVSIASLFTAIENATAQSAQIAQLTMRRQLDEKVEVVAAMKTNSFDSALFQREVYEDNPTIASISVTELDNSAEGLSNNISFTATISVPLSAIPYTVTVTDIEVISAPSIEAEVESPVTTGQSEVSDDFNNTGL